MGRGWSRSDRLGAGKAMGTSGVARGGPSGGPSGGPWPPRVPQTSGSTGCTAQPRPCLGSRVTLDFKKNRSASPHPRARACTPSPLGHLSAWGNTHAHKGWCPRRGHTANAQPLGAPLSLGKYSRSQGLVPQGPYPGPPCGPKDTLGRVPDCATAGGDHHQGPGAPPVPEYPHLSTPRRLLFD